VFFAIGRMPGWIAQWLEYQGDAEARITRPRQIYMGSLPRTYKGVEAR
jgi:citrate synthase